MKSSNDLSNMVFSMGKASIEAKYGPIGWKGLKQAISFGSKDERYISINHKFYTIS